MRRMAINTWNESHLHAALKRWYARPGDALEFEVDGAIIDIVRGDLLIEIQTGSLSHLKGKLERLLPDHRVRLVLPVAARRYIVRLEGERQISRRRSPRRGTWWHAFAELVYVAPLLPHPYLSLELVLVEEEQLLRQTGRRAWRRRGWNVVDRRLLSVVEQRRFDSPARFLELLPASLPAPFTTAQLAGAIGAPPRLAGKVAYTLWRTEALQRVGKRGRAYLYLPAATSSSSPAAA